MCDPILVTLLKMRLHYSQSTRENVTPSSGTSPLASYKEVPPLPGTVVIRFKKESMYGLSAGWPPSGRCGEVVVSGGSTGFF